MLVMNWFDPWQYFYWVVAYLSGGISFAYMVSQWIHNVDLRRHGSGNLGATNVLRVIGKSWGFTVLILDALKGALPVYLALMRWQHSNHYAVIFTGIFAILGHIFSPYLKFRGGKGVATSLGVFAVLVPYPVGVGLVIFLLTVLSTGYVALGSMFAAITVPAIAFFFYGWETNELLLSILFAVGALILYTHRSNMVHIWQGEERKIFHFWSKKV